MRLRSRWCALMVTGGVAVAVGLTLIGGSAASALGGVRRPAPGKALYRDNAVRIWNFTSVPRDINGTVYSPGGGSGVAHGDPTYISVQGCNRLEFFNPSIGRAWFRFTYGDQDNRVDQGYGGRYTSESGAIYFVSRHDDSSSFIEWEVEVLKC
jgi:hypothetical protein